MTQRLFTDRSRYEDGLRCARLRWYGYHAEGRGISAAKTPLPLAVGASVHEGLAHLLRVGNPCHDPLHAMAVEDGAVEIALADFARYARAIDLPDQEAATVASAMPETFTTLTTQLMDLLGQDSTEARAAAARDTRSEIDDYLYREQSALVEALVRAYARRRLCPLLEQFEVLEVEQEGKWLLARDDGYEAGHFEYDLWFMSRPDALLRERSSNALYLLSFKTAGGWDVRRARDAEHDMQGMSEGIEVERRLHDWWVDAHHAGPINPVEGRTQRMLDFLGSLDAPPRILGVRYEFLLKGERWKDKDLTARFGGVEMRSQRSHLIRHYVATSTPQRGTASYQIGDECWSWDYVKDDGSAGSLAWQNWKSRAVWEVTGAGGAPIAGGVKAWIDKLDTAAEVMSAEDPTAGLEPRSLGYGCDAQAMGTTTEHPLDAAFVPPIVVYRNEDELRDLIDQMEAVERGVQEGAAAVAASEDEGERRHLLNVHFPMTRRACEYPTTCAMAKICYGGEEIRRDPVASGLYKIREPNHPQELEGDKDA